MAMTLVSTVTVGSGGAASIEWTGIPATGKDLLILVSARATNSGDRFGANLQINSNFSSARKMLLGDGSGYVESGSYGTFSVPGSTATSNTFGSTSIYISNYTSSSNKSWQMDTSSEGNAATSMTQNEIVAGRTDYTSEITTITLSSVTFAQHSTASLYIIS